MRPTFRATFALLAALTPFTLGADSCHESSSGTGSVGALCGGLDASTCDVGLYCDFAADAGQAQATGAGRCATMPEPTACTLQYEPVCGLDGRTYGNACLAAASGATVVAQGECQPDVVGCIALYDPVCGADGRTYGNACEAAAAGVDVASQGECAGGACPEPAPLAPNTICPDGTIGGPVCTCDAAGCHWEIRSCATPTYCGGFAGASCAPGEFCDYAVGDLCGAADQTGVCRPIPTFCTFEYAPVCGCDGNTYSNPCMAAGNGVSVFEYGACGGTTTTCDPSACGVPPLSPLPYECLPDASGVCTWQLGCLPPPCAAPPPGCRYENYTQCSCGTLVCDPPVGGACGGIVGLGCAAGEFCDFDPSTSCGAGDQQGTCRVIPDACTADYAPVCGCDGKTYSNACSAAANGVSVASTGACGGTTCDPTACGPAPASPLPVECLPDANGTCTWQTSCIPPACAAPPPGCRLEGATSCSCGTLVCDQCALVDCLPPGPGCQTLPDGTCCGATSCP